MARTNRDRAIKQVEKRIVPVSEVPAYVKVLLYGRNGKEKTRTAANSGLKTLIIDVNEEGTRSVTSYANCYVITIKRWEEFVWVFWYLKEGQPRLQDRGGHRHPDAGPEAVHEALVLKLGRGP
jgi:hypothetical protein